jgi:hypothetical protein
MRRRTSLALLLTLASLATACGGGGGGSDDTAAPASTTTPLPAMPADFDWWDPSPTPIGRGWVLERCVDDRPKGTLCFDNPDGRQGLLKLFRFQAPADGDLNAHAGRFVVDFVDDRKRGCGEGYKVTAEPIQALHLADGDARFYGFTGGATGSGITERTVQWAGIRGPALEIITISVYDPGSCIVPNGEGTLQDLEEVLPGVDALVQAAGMPGEPPD